MRTALAIVLARVRRTLERRAADLSLSRARSHDLFERPVSRSDIVPRADAASGFESQPNERLGRLVAEGRTFGANDTPASPGIAARSTSSSAPDCATWRRQIVDIDQLLVEPNTTRTLDYWRQVRQDVRMSMARAHCRPRPPHWRRDDNPVPSRPAESRVVGPRPRPPSAA